MNINPNIRKDDLDRFACPKSAADFFDKRAEQWCQRLVGEEEMVQAVCLSRVRHDIF
jgi:hypothetical protein